MLTKLTEKARWIKIDFNKKNTTISCHDDIYILTTFVGTKYKLGKNFNIARCT